MPLPLPRLLAALACLAMPLLAAAQPGLPSTADPFAAPFSAPFADPFADTPAEVRVHADASVTSVAPGSQFAIAVSLDHAPGWHSWPAAGQVDLGKDFDFAIRTAIAATAPGVTFGPVQWPPTKPAAVPSFDGMGTVDKPVYAGLAVAYLPVQLDPDAPVGTPLEIELQITYQACDDTACLQPETLTRTITLPIVALGQNAQTSTDPLFAAFDATTFADTSVWGAAIEPPTPSGRGFFGLRVPSPTDPAGVVIVALLAAAGGFILNLTPCVLPVIPLKVMTISKHAGSPGRSLVLGLWMAAGVVLFWAGLGVLAASVSAFADPSRIFGYWWVTAGIGLAIGIFGVGIMGAFTINLPRAVYAVNPKADSPTGSLLFGVMTAVLGLPCFGFVAGALLAGSAALPWGVVLTIFTALGVGMASPYLVLSAFPKLVDRIPRTGPASELVKQVMGLLLLAAAAYFIGSGMLALLGGIERFATGMPWWAKSAHWWVVALLASAAGLWLLWRTVAISKKALPRLSMGLLGLVVAGGGIAAAYDRTTDAYHNIWVPFTPEALARARAEGRTVVLDFTAEWCLNCKALKGAVLSRAPVKPRLLEPGVVPMVADLTSTSAPGWDKLRELGETGIPLLVVYGPALDEPWKANAYTAAMVTEALDRARAPALSDARP